ncbi:MAG: hypothetical protein BEN19_00025 [Epulopiscium sp. Nuni2H_MBin003]|nr:MAG: hypothetical protein BEN19_00025 [Epulopiscium sp. Nuni2H_MBin003]
MLKKCEEYKEIIFCILVIFFVAVISIHQDSKFPIEYKSDTDIHDANIVEVSTTHVTVEDVNAEELFNEQTNLVQIDLHSIEVDKVAVYICGEVNNPDVYQIEEHKLLYDLVHLAGGFTEDADKNSINLAQKISPNSKVVIPKIGDITYIEYADVDSVNYEKSDKININTATKNGLMELPGIGDVKADAIIKYREENGTFKSIDELANVSGIGQGTITNIKDLIIH